MSICAKLRDLGIGEISMDIQKVTVIGARYHGCGYRADLRSARFGGNPRRCVAGDPCAGN